MPMFENESCTVCPLLLGIVSRYEEEQGKKEKDWKEKDHEENKWLAHHMLAQQHSAWA
jgi:hypothetical protein